MNLRTMTAALTMLALLAAGCGDEQPTETEDFDFRVEVSVVDAAGNPVEGLNVGVANDLYIETDKDESPALLTIPFVLPEESIVRLFVQDIEGDRMNTLIDEIMPVGLHTYLWNGYDSDEEPLQSGRYTLLLVTFQPGGTEQTFSAECDVFLQRDPGELSLGLTGASGTFTTLDTRLFPFFYDLEDMIATDEVGERIGVFSEMTTTTVAVWSDAGDIVTDAFAFELEPNEVELVFDPDKALRLADRSAEPAPSRLTTKALADEANFELRDPYPNPFN